MEFTRRKIKTPKTLGEILIGARKKKDVTLEQAEEETKVRIKYLEALEQGRYEALPASVYAIGFLTKYAEFLGLNKESLVERFSGERGKGYNHAKIMVERRIHEPLFSITPKFFAIIGITLVLVAILGYIAYSVNQFTSPPNLEILSPTTNQVYKDENLDIIGKTDEGATLTINGQNVQIDDMGNFRQTVKLHPGLNSFEIRSINALKKENVKLIKVVADLPVEILPTPVSLPSVTPSPLVSPKTSPKPSPTVTK